MQKKLILSLSIVFSCFLAMGQAGNDKVFLKDGSFIRGTIIELKAEEMVKIQTAEGEIRELPMVEVKRTLVDGKYTRARSKYAYESHTGYFNATSINLILGGNRYGSRANLGIHTLNGFQYKGKWQAGIGTGLEFISDRLYVPLTGVARYHLRDKDVSPFVGAFGGYSLTRKTEDSRSFWGQQYPTEHKGGATWGFELGLRNMTKSNLGYTLSAGYRFQQLKTSGYDGWWNGSDQIYYPVEENQKLHRLVLNFGITFN